MTARASGFTNRSGIERDPLAYCLCIVEKLAEHCEIGRGGLLTGGNTNEFNFVVHLVKKRGLEK